MMPRRTRIVTSQFQRPVLPETEADQYFWADIEGVTVHSGSGEVLGEVEQILESSAHPILAGGWWKQDSADSLCDRVRFRSRA